MNQKIDHYKCASCNKEISYVESGKDEDIVINHHTFFKISRSNVEFELDDNEIDIYDENIKMEMLLCEKCFLNALNESKTLGNLFLDKGRNKFIY